MYSQRDENNAIKNNRKVYSQNAADLSHTININGSIFQFKNIEVCRIISDLQKRDTQEEAAKKLHQYLSQYQEDCDDNLFNHFKSMLESANIEHKLGAILAINKIVKIGRQTRIVHNVKKIMEQVFNQLDSPNDQTLVEKAAECLGILAEAGGKNTADAVDSIPQRVIDILSERDPKSNSKKYGAVLVLKEFCKKLPIITFNKLFDRNQNFRYLFNALQDQRIFVRQTAADCINECIKLIGKRDYNNDQKKNYLQEIYEQIDEALYQDNDINQQQAALSVLSELIQINSGKGSSIQNQNVITKNEKKIIKQILKLIESSKGIQVKRQCISLLPQLVKNLPEFQNSNENFFKQAIDQIFNFMEKSKKEKVKKEAEISKGVAFISFGKISLLARKDLFQENLDQIFKLIEQEIRPPKFDPEIYCKPIQNTDVLICIKDLAKTYGSQIEKYFSKPPSGTKINDKIIECNPNLQKSEKVIGGLGSFYMYRFITSLFYFGFNKPLIEALKELTIICKGQYRMGIQTKLMNTIHIILTHQIDYFPAEQLILIANKGSKDQQRRINKNLNQKYQKQDNQEIQRESPGFNNLESIISQKSISQDQLGQKIQNQESKIVQESNKLIENLDIASIYNPKFIDKVKAQNLKELLSIENQFFILNLCQGIKEQKQQKKFAKEEIEQIKSDQIQMIILAIKVLNNFGLDEIESNFNILQFMSDSVLPYLSNENPEIRLEAVQTFSSLKFEDKQKLNPQQEIQVNKLLHKFFVTATTDPDINIRTQMLMKLNSDLDPFIARYENLLMLFNCMRDSNNQINIKTIKILGRLTNINPQHILPYLRNLIVSLISQLEHSHQYKEREDAAKLIKAFVKYNRELSKSYAQSILNCLFQRIDQDKRQKITTPFISALLEVMREISFVDPDATKPYIGQIFPLILESVKDQSDSYKREVALNTLIAIIDNTGFVVKPYFFYPELLTIIRNLVQSEQLPEIKNLVFKLIGTLGAVDPYLINQIKFYHKQKNSNEEDEMINNLPFMLGIEPGMIKQNNQSQYEIEDNDIKNFHQNKIYHNVITNSHNHHNSSFQMKNQDIFQNYDSKGFGMNQNQQQQQVQIVLDIDRIIIGDEYSSELGFQNNLENFLKKYNMKKPEITKENKFSMIAMESLIKILNDQTLMDHHITVLKGIDHLVNEIGKDCIEFLPLIIPSILNWIGLDEGIEMSPLQITKFYDSLKNIIKNAPQCINQYLNMIFDTIEKVIIMQIQMKHSNQGFGGIGIDNTNFFNVLILLKDINMRSKEKYLPQMNFILPRILQLVNKNLGMDNAFSQNENYFQKNQYQEMKNVKKGNSQQNKYQINESDICKEAFQMIQELNSITKDDNIHLVIPLLVRLLARQNYNELNCDIDFKIKILQTIQSFLVCKSFREYLTTIVHAVVNLIDLYHAHPLQKDLQDFNNAILKLICEIAENLKIDFAPFIPMIHECLIRAKKVSNEFNQQIEKISKYDLIDLFVQNLKKSQLSIQKDKSQNVQNAPKEEKFVNFFEVDPKKRMADAMNNLFIMKDDQNNQSMRNAYQKKRLVIDYNLLMNDFDSQNISIEADWIEWLKQTSLQLLKQSPNPVINVCGYVAGVYHPIAHELYNVAFLTLWKEFNDQFKENLIKEIRTPIFSKMNPRLVLQTILNLHEFIELDEGKNKIFEEKTLAEIAEKCNAYAKALYYWEKEFQNEAKCTIEKIITTNYRLGQQEAAKGVLVFSQRNQMIEKDDEIQFETPEWLEKRHEWNNALEKYSELLENDPNNYNYQTGKLRCLKKQSDWKNLSGLVHQMWDQEQQSQANIQSQNQKIIQQIAYDGLESAFNLNEWSDFSDYIQILKQSKSPNSFDKCFYSTILEIKNKRYNYAHQHIEKARQILDPQITSLLGESYSRAYSLIQDLQCLKELEEVIYYVQTPKEQIKNRIYSLWQKRFEVQPSEDLRALQRSLNIRCIVIDKTEEVDQYIRFALLAQNQGNNILGQTVLNNLLQDLQIKLQKEAGKSSQNTIIIQNDIAKVKLSIYENDYNNMKQERAIQLLENLIFNNQINDEQILSESYLKLSKWIFDFKDQQLKQVELNHLISSKNYLSEHRNYQQFFNQNQMAIQQSQLTAADYEKSIKYCEKAIEIQKTNNEAWHYYSQINYEASKFYQILFAENIQESIPEKDLNKSDQINQNDKNQIDNSQNESQESQNIYKIRQKKIIVPENYGEQIVKMTLNQSSKLSQNQIKLGKKYILHIINSIQGLVQQLQLSDQITSSDSSKTLQNTLRFMKIWFRHGNYQQIDDIVRQGIEKINLKLWINVIPQLLARIDIQENMIKTLLMDLLERLSQKFPHALVYSLSVSIKSRSKDRREAAEALINKLKLTQGVLIEQANMISDELIRAAILLSEKWTAAIDEASRIYFQKNDAETMIAFLSDFHKMMEQPPETMNEINFYQGFASDLEEAQLWTQLYQQTKCQADMNQAWDIYLNVFNRIGAKYLNPKLPIQFYELRNVAPKLLAQENMKIAVPGTFRCGKNIIRIAKFNQVLPVFNSKQHPRKLSMMGDDGREYVFLLKGHEDIRQDERVMQLFGLVNTLLQIDSKTCKKDLSIRRYPVIPLSHQAGLIGMVPNVDTLNQLIRDHRTQQNIIHNTETKTMELMFENYESLPLLNKVEVFRYSQDNTQGEDLQKVLWLKSQNSEIWLERRTNYTRSLAVMSMVGYILGLGDRHPSNILLDRSYGKIIHIDFGDCFESAMRREKFPEKIPFRLTRMLQKAMEVSGIEGNYRNTCENTMRVMRANKDSLLAILEAFVYDPLLSFRLLNLNALINQKKGEKEVFRAPDIQDKNVKNQSIKVDILDALKQKTQKEIRHSIVEATIEKYRYLGDHKDFAVRSYAQKSIDKKNDEYEIQKMINDKKEEEVVKKELNQAAEIIVQRINDKLRGTEFPLRQHQRLKKLKYDQESINSFGKNLKDENVLRKQTNKQSIEEQVELLIEWATNQENLAQLYPGWCPFW